MRLRFTKRFLWVAWHQLGYSFMFLFYIGVLIFTIQYPWFFRGDAYLWVVGFAMVGIIVCGCRALVWFEIGFDDMMRSRATKRLEEKKVNICYCGSQAGYPHDRDCPRPLYLASPEEADRWEQEYDERQKARQDKEAVNAQIHRN